MSKLYEALGLLKDATAEQIKSAYRSLAQRYHPDKGGSVDEFQKVQAAYETLGDADKRAEYDRTGQAGPNKPPLRDQAMAEFGSMLNALMNSSNLDFDHTSMVSQMCQIVDAKLAHLGQQRNAIEQKIARTENARERLTVKQGDNSLRLILDFLIQSDNGTLSKIKDAEEVMQEMDTMLNDYEYRVDEMPYVIQNPWTTMFTSPTSG